MIPPLITVDYAVKQANLDVYDAGLVMQKVMEASGIVMKHCKLEEFPDEWAEDETASPVQYLVPFDIQAATFLLFGELWQNRESGAYEPSENWKRLLRGHRHPTMA